MKKPEDLIFHIQNNEEPFVALTTKKCWETEKCQSDDLGGHNVPRKALEDAGVEPDEVMESVFELTGEFTPEEVREKLLAAGFTQNEEFSRFMEGHREE